MAVTMTMLLQTSVPLLCLLYTSAQAFSMDYNDNFFPEEFDSPSSMYERSPESLNSVEKRQWSSPACRRCMYRRDDWRSCITCYNHPGAPIPFYGGFSKRSEPSVTVDKRAAMEYCRCCLRSSENTSCCSRCNMTPFYMPYKKRSYHTSFVPIGDTGSGRCALCCSPNTFDFYCCAFSCGEKRRK